ncbi:MAG: GC-type dockerin domain-anchored protein [Phycisphaerales bacterium]
MHRPTAACLVLALAATANAQELEYLGDTTDGDRFNRPSSLSALSGFATDVAFEPVQIEVTETGSYTILSDQTNFGLLWDGYLLVYETAFDPASPLDNLVGINDDYFGSMLPGVGVGYSGLDSIVLNEGVAYFIVHTGFSNDDAGPYQAQVSGPGSVRIFTCYADLNGDSQLDIFDFLEFQNLFDAGDDQADCDDNGTLDIFDFLCFQNAFDAGCE